MFSKTASTYLAVRLQLPSHKLLEAAVYSMLIVL
jgi:hypothetical protein